ncbi:hypothetical protein EJP617_04210 [Erwinia sp. Ejp617]|nr:hypothetical protein EJP617_04210 [Erwinia sp. Ejp617]
MSGLCATSLRAGVYQPQLARNLLRRKWGITSQLLKYPAWKNAP